MERVECVVIGAGPAGLRAAQVLAEAGRDVLVLEKNPDIGPKTCAGGLTRKAVRELAALGLPRDAGLESVGFVSFAGEPLGTPNVEVATVRTLARQELGRLQAAWTRRAGAEILTATPATRLDLGARTIRAGDRVMRYEWLIGADGSDSAVRRAAGLRCRRDYFAGELNVPGVRLTPLRIECDARALANGYFWVFPHRDHTSIGAVAPTRAVRPADLRRYLERRAADLRLEVGTTRFEGATLEVEPVRFDLGCGAYLAGDAAGLPSALTAEGIYAAVVSGEEVGRMLLDPGYPAPKTRAWLRAKRAHDRVARALASRGVRAAALPLLACCGRSPALGRRLAQWMAGE